MRQRRRTRRNRWVRNCATLILTALLVGLGLVAAPGATADPSNPPTCPANTPNCVDPINTYGGGGIDGDGGPSCTYDIYSFLENEHVRSVTKVKGVVIGRGAPGSGYYVFNVAAGQLAKTVKTVPAPLWYPTANGGRSQTIEFDDYGPQNTPYCQDAWPVCPSVATVNVGRTSGVNNLDVVALDQCSDPDGPTNQLVLSGFYAGHNGASAKLVKSGTKVLLNFTAPTSCHGVLTDTYGYVYDRFGKWDYATIKFNVYDPAGHPSPVCT